LEVEETEGAFDASKYSVKEAQLKISGNHRMDAIGQCGRLTCTNTNNFTGNN